MTCLDNLVQIVNYCEANKEGLYLHQFVDVPNSLLSHLANDAEQTGKKYSKNLLSGAVQELIADITLSATDGYSVKDIAYQYTSPCQFTNSYVAGFGIILNNYYKSNYSELVIPNIAYKPNFNGDFVIVVDDGVTPQNFTATATAGVVSNLTLEYKTTAKQVKIYTQDNTLQMATLNCTQSGCGSCGAKRGNYINLTGYNGSTPVQTAAGFIPNAYIACNMESVICAIVNKHKQLFAKALALKVAEMVYTRLLISPRLNDSTLNIDSESAKLYLNTVTAKYRELIHGSKAGYTQNAAKGILDVIKHSFKLLNDPCVTCASTNYTSTALF